RAPILYWARRVRVRVLECLRLGLAMGGVGGGPAARDGFSVGRGPGSGVVAEATERLPAVVHGVALGVGGGAEGGGDLGVLGLGGDAAEREREEQRVAHGVGEVE